MSSIVGNAVTFRWKSPSVGPGPTGYMLEGGAAAVADPRRARRGSRRSNLHGHGADRIVLRPGPVARSRRPERRLERDPGPRDDGGGAVGAHGAAGYGQRQHLHLAWTPTFLGGAGTGAVLDVTGSVSDSAAAAGGRAHLVRRRPGRRYTLRVRAVNAGGSSAASAPTVVTVPGTCAAAPRPPSNLLAYVLAAHASWSGIRRRPARRRPAIASLCPASACCRRLRAVSGALPRRHLHHLGPARRRLRRQPAGYARCLLFRNWPAADSTKARAAPRPQRPRRLASFVGTPPDRDRPSRRLGEITGSDAAFGLMGSQACSTMRSVRLSWSWQRVVVG